MDPPAQPSSNSWSIYTRSEITQKYKILDRVGSGAYSDVYRAQRLSDNATVALKEIHDYQSAFREIEALQLLKNSPNVVYLHEYFWSEEDDAVLVLEYVRTDLGAVIREAKKDWKGLEVGEIKRWMLQILSAVDSCHRSMVVHRDLKPANLLVTDDGVLKLADFGQARILVEPGFVASLDRPHQEDQSTAPQSLKLEHSELVPEDSRSQEPRTVIREECLEELDGLKARSFIDETDKDANINDGDASCLATCTASDIGSLYSLDAAAHEMTHSPLTSCVGTRWYRAPELLYGSTNYGLEIDLWSLGCIFAELLGLNRPFPGSSDIDQINQIFNVLGNLNEEAWPGCLDLPDYKIISFAKVEDPIGLEGCLPSRSRDEVLLVKKLLCYDPANRATAMELLHDKYFSEEPLPVPVSELRVPSTDSTHDESSSGGWCSCDYRDEDSDSDFEGFGPLDVRETDSGFSICFS